MFVKDKKHGCVANIMNDPKTKLSGHKSGFIQSDNILAFSPTYKAK